VADLTATTVALSPFAYYRLNEAAGTVATDTQGHSNGSYVGTYTLNATPNTANDTGSVRLGGAGDVTTNLLASDAGLTGASFSVSFFVKSATATPGNGRFVANGHTDTADQGFQVYLSAANTFRLDVRNTGLVSATNTTAFGSGTLVHVVGVVDNVNNRTLIYVNGTAGAAGPYQPMSAAPFQTAIGYNPAYAGDYVNGTISEVSFYNYALTAANVTALYAARTVAPTSGTVYTSTLTAGLTFVGSQARRTARALNAALSFVGSVSRAIATARTASLSFVGSVAKRSTRAFTATLTFSGVFASAKNAVTKLIAFTAGLTFAGAQTRAVARAFTAIVSTIGTQSKAISKSLAASLPFVGAIARATSRAFAATLAFSGAFTGARNAAVAKFIAFTASVGFAGTQTRSTLRSFFASVATAGAQTKMLSRSMSARVTFAGVQGRIIPTVLAAVLSFAGNLATFFAKGGLTAIGNREYTAGAIGTGKNAPGAAGTGDNPGGSVGNEQ